MMRCLTVSRGDVPHPGIIRTGDKASYRLRSLVSSRKARHNLPGLFAFV